MPEPQGNIGEMSPNEVIDLWRRGVITEQQAFEALARYANKLGVDGTAYAKQQMYETQFAPAAGSLQTTPGATPSLDWRALAEQEAGPAYMRRYGLGALGQTPWQSFLANQFAPTYGTFQAQNILDPNTATNWQDYLESAGGFEQARGQAKSTFKQALDRPVAQQRTFQDLLGNQAFNEFLGNVGASRFAAPVAKRFTAALPGLQSQFISEGGGEGSFLEYLKRMFGLA